MSADVGTLLWKRRVSINKQQMENGVYELRDILVNMAVHAILNSMVYFSVYVSAYHATAAKPSMRNGYRSLVCNYVLHDEENTYYVVRKIWRTVIVTTKCASTLTFKCHCVLFDLASSPQMEVYGKMIR
jgi:hypothetical protein